MSKNTCGTCAHFSADDAGENMGDCRLQPPVAHIRAVVTVEGVRETLVGIFPPVNATADWCSVWRPPWHAGQ